MLIASEFVLHRNGSSAAEALSSKEIIWFRELLEERKAKLLGEADRTAHDMGENEAEGFPDPTDRGVMESERNLELRIRDRERKLITKIEEAIERIDEGTFGLCEECEEPIGAKRLEVRPVTTLCIRCKEEQEQAEKGASR